VHRRNLLFGLGIGPLSLHHTMSPKEPRLAPALFLPDYYNVVPNRGRLVFVAGNSRSHSRSDHECVPRDMGLHVSRVPTDIAPPSQPDCLAGPNFGYPEVSDELLQASSNSSLLAVPSPPPMPGAATAYLHPCMRGFFAARLRPYVTTGRGFLAAHGFPSNPIRSAIA